jgi:PAS domain S-box-containing protein
MNLIPLNSRSSPLPARPSNRAHRHEVQFYSSDDFLLEVVSRFIAQAITAGDATMVVATQPHWDGITQILEARGIAVDEQTENGQTMFVDVDDLLAKMTVDGWVDGTKFTRIISSLLTKARGEKEGSGSQVAVFGELVALLWAQGRWQEAIQVEELWNSLARTEPFYLLCAYPLSGFNRDTHTAPFLEVCAQHSHVVPSETFLRFTKPEERLRIIACLEQKAQALDSEVRSRRSELLFRLFVDAVEDYAIFTLDSEGCIRSWNAGAERIQGYKTAEILGQHFSCFYPEDDVRSGTPKAELETAARDGRFEVEAWRVRKDGSMFWANVVITPVRDQDGRVIGFGKVTRDFTERMKTQSALQKEIAEKRKIEQRLRSSERSLRELSLHLLHTQDEERRRIGRNLHDSLGQSLAVLKMKLDCLSVFCEEPRQRTEDIDQCVHLLEDSIVELRTISYLLYPPLLDEMGLKSAIPWYLDGFAARSGIQTTFEIDTQVHRLHRDVELALFRVLQECLTNVHRHSKGSAVDIRLLTKDRCAVLQVRDNGIGLPEAGEESDQELMERPGVGLRGMKERMQELGGTFELISTPQGTTVIAIAPAEPASALHPGEFRAG